MRNPFRRVENRVDVRHREAEGAGQVRPAGASDHPGHIRNPDDLDRSGPDLDAHRADGRPGVESGPRHARPDATPDRTDRPRPSRVHLETAREAGLGRVSGLSIVSGTMCAYGAFAIVAAIAGSLLTNTDLETDFRTDDWTSTGAAAGLVTALVLFAAYLFGGYVAGRMARRSGVLHGVGVFVLSLVVGLLVGSMASLADGVDVAENLRSIGVPTDWDQVESVGVAAAVASLVAMLLGSAVGGSLGERWHTKLANRFEDPAFGPAAQARERAEREDRAHRERLVADPIVAREADTTVARDRAPIDLGTPPYQADPDRPPERRDDRVRDADREAEPVGSDPSLRGSVDDAYADRRPDRTDRPDTIDLRPQPPAESPQTADRDVHSGRRPF